MDRNEKIKEIIRQTWRVQSMSVGDVSIEKLYEAFISKKPLDELLTSPKGGSDLDLHGTWELLYEAIDLTVNVITLYAMWKQRNESSPSN